MCQINLTIFSVFLQPYVAINYGGFLLILPLFSVVHFLTTFSTFNPRRQVAGNMQELDKNVNICFSLTNL